MMLPFDATIRVSLIILIALAGTLVFRRRSAAVRHWVLALGIACAALSPLLHVFLPSWDMDIIAFSSAPPGAAAPPAVTTAVAVQHLGTPSPQLGPSEVGQGAPRGRIPLSAAVTIVWLAGAAVSVSVLLVGSRRLSRVASAARPVRTGPWVDLAADLCRTIGLSRRVSLLQSDHPTLLVTWGLARPKIILPAGAADWPRDRVRIVLGHEVAHIRRGDWAAQMIAEILRAVYWFNPLLWIACTRLREESERACDDAVLTSGVESADYASHLVDLARTLNVAPRVPGPALAMARASSLEGRVNAMLNTRLNRRPPSHVTRVATAVVLVALAIPIAVAAQHRFSTVAGTVLDQTGRFMPAATLTLTNTSNGAKYEVRTDGTGRFVFVGLPPGDYRLSVAQPGFMSFSESLAIAGDLNRTITLQIGALQETVTTTGNAAAAPDSTAAQRPEVRERADRARQQAAAKCAGGALTGEAGGNILQPMKIVDVRPAYPEALRAAGIGGVVTLEAVIGTDGTVRESKAVAPSTPEFEAAATDAVRQWEFTPTYLNCTPIEVRMKVTLNFVPQR